MESNSAEDLSLIADTRAAVADRLVTPWWYYPALGLLIAVFVLAYGLGNIGVALGGAALCAAGCGLLARAYRRLTGIWISGFDAVGSARRWAQAMGALAGVSVAASWVFGHYTDLSWLVWGFAAVAGAGSVFLGYRFDAALRAQLRAGA